MADSQRICSVDGCGKEIVARGLCDMHYRRLKKHGDPHKKIVREAAGIRPCVIAGCEGSTGMPGTARGLCASHYNRWQKHGDPVAGGTSPHAPIQWIRDHAGYEGDDCLTWPFSRGNAGYGKIQINGKSSPASRRMCIEAHGNPPDPKMEAAHSCGNGHLGCVNPRHLRWLTQRENLDERARIRKGRAHFNARLGPIDVLGVRLMAQSASYAEVGAQFGMSPIHVGKIVRRYIWAHI